MATWTLLSGCLAGLPGRERPDRLGEGDPAPVRPVPGPIEQPPPDPPALMRRVDEQRGEEPAVTPHQGGGEVGNLAILFGDEPAIAVMFQQMPVHLCHTHMPEGPDGALAA
jgi:hypothetical protein